MHPMTASTVTHRQPTEAPLPQGRRPEVVDRELFRAVAGHFASGVAVITSRDGGVDFGATVSAVSSVSLDPPTLLVCLNTRMGTQAAAHRSRAFAVNILDETQGEIARRFATPNSDKFDGVRFRHGALGLPLIEGSLAHIECQVREDLIGGTHRIFIGEVCTAESRNGRPLSYFRGSFGRFVKFDEDLVYQRLRTQFLGSYHAQGMLIDVSSLSRDLAVDEALVCSALGRLRAEGLVAFEGSDRWAVRPLDSAQVKAAIDLRATLEIGAVTTALLQGVDLPRDSLRCRLAVIDRFISFGSRLDGVGFVEADHRLHESVVGLTQNAGLLATYKSNAMVQAMHWIIGSDRELAASLQAANVGMVGALERRDIAGASQAIRTHVQLLAQAVDCSVRDQACRI
jgi:flavin reductase (DIM6/NTAB) family NADH-FMN oxidoreductase RutF/DNA-binding FadR family transcriptional regulator